MKKSLLFIAVAALASFCSFSEVVSWKGMEMGLGQNPKWIRSWRAKGDERALRKKLGAEPGSTIIVGLGRADSLEGARTAAQLDAQGKAVSKGETVQTVRLDFLGEYWEEDDQEGFSVWSVYER